MPPVPRCSAGLSATSRYRRGPSAPAKAGKASSSDEAERRVVAAAPTWTHGVGRASATGSDQQGRRGGVERRLGRLRMRGGCPNIVGERSDLLDGDPPVHRRQRSQSVGEPAHRRAELSSGGRELTTGDGDAVDHAQGSPGQRHGGRHAGEAARDPGLGIREGGLGRREGVGRAREISRDERTLAVLELGASSVEAPLGVQSCDRRDRPHQQSQHEDDHSEPAQDPEHATTAWGVRVGRAARGRAVLFGRIGPGGCLHGSAWVEGRPAPPALSPYGRWPA